MLKLPRWGGVTPDRSSTELVRDTPRLHYAWVIVAISAMMWMITSPMVFATSLLIPYFQDPKGFGWSYFSISIAFALQWLCLALGFSDPAVPRPSPRETAEAAASPLLSGLSRPPLAALRLAAGRRGRGSRRGRGGAADGGGPEASGQRRGKMPFKLLIPLLPATAVVINRECSAPVSSYKQR